MVKKRIKQFTILCILSHLPSVSAVCIPFSNSDVNGVLLFCGWSHNYIKTIHHLIKSKDYKNISIQLNWMAGLLWSSLLFFLYNIFRYLVRGYLSLMSFTVLGRNKWANILREWLLKDMLYYEMFMNYYDLLLHLYNIVYYDFLWHTIVVWWYFYTILFYFCDICVRYCDHMTFSRKS